MKPQQPPPLHSIVFKLLASRWIFFSLITGLIILESSYVSGQRQIDSQRNATILLAQNAGNFFESADRALNALAAISPNQRDLTAIQQAYSTFDALYLISSSGRLLGMSPVDKQLRVGMDMSGQPYFNSGLEGFSFSKPFISQRTGNPTIYISLPLKPGDGVLVGELNLAGLQESVIGSGLSQTGVYYITDAEGVMLAHPDYEWVRQQENIRALGIIEQLQKGQAQRIFLNDRRWVVGMVVEVPQSGWLAVTETPLFTVYGSFMIPSILGMMAALVLFVLIVRREQVALTRQVIDPLGELSRIAHDLAAGDPAQHEFTLSLPAAFSEVASLAESFERMSQAVQSRTLALRASEEQYQLAMEATKDGLWDWDILSDSVDYSPGYSLMLGFEIDEFPAVASSWRHHIHPEDRQRVLDRNTDCIENRCQSFEIEYRAKTKTGDWKWVLSRAKSVTRDSSGRALRLVGVMMDISERKQAEDCLLESETRYHMLFEHSAIPIWEEDFSQVKVYFDSLRQMDVRDFRVYFENHPEDVEKCGTLVKILDVNQKSLDFFQVSSREAMVRNLPAYFTEASWPVFKEEMIALADGQTEFSSEIPIRMLSGEVKQLMLALSVAPAYQDSLARVLVSFIDITERKSAESQREMALDALRVKDWAIESSINAIAFSDLKGSLTYVNPAFLHLWGYSSPAEVLGKSVSDFWQKSESAEEVMGTLNPEKGWSGDMLARKRDGSNIDVQVDASLVLDTAGRPFCLLASFVDITERKMAEAALSESEKRYHSLFEDSPTILLEEDFSAVKQRLEGLRAKEGVTNFRQYLTQHPEIVAECATLVKVLDVNKAALKLYGVDSKEQMSKDLAPLFSEEDFENFLDEWVRIANGESHFETEIINRTLDGRTVTLHMKWTVTPGHEDDLSKVMVSMNDISERKELTEKMILSEKMAGLGTLAAGVAHEINSPLQVVTGASETLLIKLKEENLNREGLERRVKHIQENAWRIVKIVRSLLDYARSSQEEMGPTSLNSIVNDTLLLIEHQIHVWSNVKVVTDLAENLPDLICDRNKIIQVAINLLNNARDAMPHGGVLTLRTRFDPTSQRLSLAVSDAGEGIPEDALTRIFDPFFTTKSLGQGTGLGLSVAQGIIQAHGGDISVVSQVGVGSTFTIFLPLMAVPEDKPPDNIQGRYQESEFST
jgi:PAS domain S-box-containing protein